MRLHPSTVASANINSFETHNFLALRLALIAEGYKSLLSALRRWLIELLFRCKTQG
jgi:hypothetical protein